MPAVRVVFSLQIIQTLIAPTPFLVLLHWYKLLKKSVKPTGMCSSYPIVPWITWKDINTTKKLPVRIFIKTCVGLIYLFTLNLWQWYFFYR